MPKKWIQKAVHPSKEGSFTRYAKTKGGMAAGIRAGLKSHNKTTQRRAKFAKAMQTVRHKK